jgi:hypothetical protein
MSHPRRTTHIKAPNPSLALRLSITANLLMACVITGEAFYILWLNT